MGFSSLRWIIADVNSAQNYIFPNSTYYFFEAYGRKEPDESEYRNMECYYSGRTKLKLDSTNPALYEPDNSNYHWLITDYGPSHEGMDMATCVYRGYSQGCPLKINMSKNKIKH